MKGRFTLILVSFVLSIIIFCCSISLGDIAPVRLLEGGTAAAFVENTQIILFSYDVNVEVNENNVTESLSYCLYNPTNNSINETIMVPIIFTQEFSLANDTYFYDTALNLPIGDFPNNWSGNFSEVSMSAELTIDNNTVKILQGNITTASYHYMTMEGVYANVFLENNSFTNITVNCSLTPGCDGLENFGYFYTAETAAFWNGTVHHGMFHLKYNGQWNHTIFMAPNATNNGTEVFSEVWDIDVRTVDANYTVVIDTGYVAPPYHSIYPNDENHDWVILAVIVAAIVAIISYALFRRCKKKQL